MVKPEDNCRGCACAGCQKSSKYGVLCICRRCETCNLVRLAYCQDALSVPEGEAFVWR